MKKTIVTMLISTVLFLTMSITTLAAGSISGASFDISRIEAENVVVDKKSAENVVYAQEVQAIVDAVYDVFESGEDENKSIGDIMRPLTSQSIDRYWWKDVDERNVDLGKYKVLYNTVFDITLIQGDPSVTPGVIKLQDLQRLTNEIDADVLHYCSEHGWEILNGVENVAEKSLLVEYHSFSPSIIIYKDKQKSTGGGWSAPSFYPTATPVPAAPTAAPVVAPVEKDDVYEESVVESSEKSVIESSEESLVEFSEESVVESGEESGVPAGAEAEGSGSVLPIVLIAAVLVAIGIFLIIFLKKKKDQE